MSSSTGKKLTTVLRYFHARRQKLCAKALRMTPMMPNGGLSQQPSNPPKFPAKEKFYQDLQSHLSTAHNPKEALAVVGDFNVAPTDADLGIGPDNVKRWLRDGKACFLPEEREWFETLCQWGLQDTWRTKHPSDDAHFSWFDYRSKGFDKEPKRGLRIDHILATDSLATTLRDSGIEYGIRAMDKPSDHCPVWSSFDI